MTPDTGKPQYSEKNLPGDILSTTNPTQTGLGLSPRAPRWEAMDYAPVGLSPVTRREQNRKANNNENKWS